METKTEYPEMTIDEIEAQFDGEWVLVGDPETDESLKVTRGKVLCHSRDNEEITRCMMSLRDSEFKRTATLYNGDVPEGKVIMF